MKHSWVCHALARLGHVNSQNKITAAECVKQSLLHRACIALRCGKTELSRAYLDELEHCEKDSACLNVLGLIALAEHKQQVARKLWNESLCRNPSYIPAMVNLRRLLFQPFADDRVLFGDEPAVVIENIKVHS